MRELGQHDEQQSLVQKLFALLISFSLLFRILKRALFATKDRISHINKARVEYESSAEFLAYSTVIDIAVPLITLPLPIAIAYTARNFLIMTSIAVPKFILDKYYPEISKIGIDLIPIVSGMFRKLEWLGRASAISICEMSYIKDNLSESSRIKLYVLLLNLLPLYHYYRCYRIQEQALNKLGKKIKNFESFVREHFTLLGNANISQAEVILIGETHTNSTHKLLQNIVISELSTIKDHILLEGMKNKKTPIYSFFIKSNGTFHHNSEQLKLSPLLEVYGWEDSQGMHTVNTVIGKLQDNSDKMSSYESAVSQYESAKKDLKKLKESLALFAKGGYVNLEALNKFTENTLNRFQTSGEKLLKSADEFSKTSQALSSEPEYTDSKILHARNDALCKSILSYASFFNPGRVIAIAGRKHADENSSIHSCLKEAGKKYSVLLPK